MNADVWCEYSEDVATKIIMNKMFRHHSVYVQFICREIHEDLCRNRHLEIEGPMRML